MKKLKIANGLHLRHCLFHPKERAVKWSGHVHLFHMDSITYTVGRCKFCPKDDLVETTNYQSPCKGCFGIIEGIY